MAFRMQGAYKDMLAWASGKSAYLHNRMWKAIDASTRAWEMAKSMSSPCDRYARGACGRT